MEDKGFKEFIHMLNPTYNLPSRYQLSRHFLPFAYEKLLNETKVKLQEEAVSVCLTTDCWTSINNTSFLAVTTHYIDPNFNFQSILLQCASFDEKHTSLNLSAIIQSIIDEWNLNNKIVLVVSDNAANIKNAINILNLKHFGCFAHSLNLIVQEGLKSQSNLIGIIKSIVGHFKRNSNSNHKLMMYQQNSGENPKELLQDVATRWNSTYHMLSRFVELENSLKATIAIINADLCTLTSEEWKICKELCLVLKPFDEVTKSVSGENYMSASIVIVLYKGLLDVCDKLSKKSFEPSVNETIKILKHGLAHRFCNLEMSNTLSISTFLDPKFKHYALSKTVGDQIKTKIINAISLNIKNTTDTSQITSTIVNSAEEDKNEYCIWEKFDSIASTITSQGTNTSKSIIEVNRYMEESVLVWTGDSFGWWREHRF